MNITSNLFFVFSVLAKIESSCIIIEFLRPLNIVMKLNIFAK